MNIEPSFHPPSLGRVNSVRRWWTLRSATEFLLALLIVIVSFVDFVPFSPSLPSLSLDSGWELALNIALEKGMIFGRDIVFTFGPYASIYTVQYHPAVNTQLLWSSGLLAVAFAASLICLTRDFYRLAAIGAAIFLVIDNSFLRDTHFYAMCFVSLILICRVAMPPGHPARIVLTNPVKFTLALLVVALSLLPLIKGTFAISSGMVMLLGCILIFRAGQRALALGGAVLYFVAMAALWVIARQPIGGLPQFFISQAPIVGGYTSAMYETGPLWQILVYVAGCVLLTALSARSVLSAGLSGLFVVSGSVLLMLLAFKEAFVRDDGHSYVAGVMMGFSGWMIMLLGRRGALPVLGLAIGLTGWIIIDHGEFSPPNAAINLSNCRLIAVTVTNNIVDQFISAEDGLITRISAPNEMRESYISTMAAISAAEPLPKLSGTTDIYSFGQSALLANGLDWDPRPVIQSYTAYTPGLAKLNADHLKGVLAPDNIVFSVQPIDGRLPALEDSLSWPLLLSRYNITGFENDVAILKKRAVLETGSEVSEIPILSRNFRLAEPVPLPKNLPSVWVQIDVKPSFMGRLLELIYKRPGLSITYTLSNGSQRKFRYIAEMGASGFLAAPLIETTTDFGALSLPNAGDYFSANRPISLEITADHGGRWAWRRSFRARFFELRIPVQPTASSVLFSQWQQEPKQTTHLPVTADCSIDRINQRNGIQRSVVLNGFLNLYGWGAISGKDGIAPQSIDVMLTASDGTALSLATKLIPRGDVNVYFHQPSMGMVGFLASAQTTSLSGDYMLGLVLSRGGRSWSCETKIPIHVVNANADLSP